MQIQPYLFFEGRCDEALAFYGGALGAKVTTLLRYRDSPQSHPPGKVPPGSEDKVMHASVRIGETNLLASDGRCQGTPGFQGFGLTLAVANEAEADRYFAALAEDGTVQMPLARTFFSPALAWWLTALACPGC